MPALHELTTVLRSKNAGPFEVTIDLLFADTATFRRVVDCGALNCRAVAERYGIAADKVRVVPYPRARAIKITVPRIWGRSGAGSPGDRDVYGAQQHAPLLDLQVML